MNISNMDEYVQQTAPSEISTSYASPKPITMNDEKHELMKLSIKLLKKKCYKLKISAHGNKTELVNRIIIKSTFNEPKNPNNNITTFKDDGFRRIDEIYSDEDTSCYADDEESDSDSDSSSSSSSSSSNNSLYAINPNTPPKSPDNDKKTANTEISANEKHYENGVDTSSESETETKCEYNKQHTLQQYISWDDSKISVDIRYCVDELEENNKVCIISTHGLQSGYHEWSVHILKCDIFSIEIGCVEVCDIDDIIMDDNGINGTPLFGARAIYGDEWVTNTAFYASYNDDNTERCYKDLSNQTRWSTGDVIKVCLDLDSWRIKFLLNDQNVRKSLSLQSNKMYFPCIAFTGDCQFGIIM